MSRRCKLLVRMVRRHYRTTPRRTYEWRDIEFFINGVSFTGIESISYVCRIGDSGISYAWSDIA